MNSQTPDFDFDFLFDSLGFVLLVERETRERERERDGCWVLIADFRILIQTYQDLHGERAGLFGTILAAIFDDTLDARGRITNQEKLSKTVTARIGSGHRHPRAWPNTDKNR